MKIKEVQFLVKALLIAMLVMLPLVSCDDDDDSTEGASTTVITFEDLEVPSDGYWVDEDGKGLFEVGKFSFISSYTDFGGYESWFGIVYSTLTDMATAGYTNDKSVYNTEGADDSEVYALAYVSDDDDDWYDDGEEQKFIELSDSKKFKGMYVCNTTYAYLSMKDGDSFAKKFGGDSGDDEDYFLLTVRGYDSDGNESGSTDFYLADYRFSDSADDYIVDEWTFVDLTGLGDEVKQISFELTSSDSGDYGMNTPAYFAFDNLEYYDE